MGGTDGNGGMDGNGQTQSPAHNDGTGTTRGGGGGAATVAVGRPRRQFPHRPACAHRCASVARGQREHIAPVSAHANTQQSVACARSHADVTARRSSTRRARRAARRGAARRRAPRVAAADAEEARGQLRAPKAKIAVRARTPTRPRGAARCAVSVAQSDAA